MAKKTKKNTKLLKSRNIENTKLKHTSLKAIILVILCTIFTSTGQILWKVGARTTNEFNIIQLVTNIPLMLGYVSYCLGAVFLILSLKEGELSVIYPFVALSFIWVTITSILLFHEQVYLINWIGIGAILFGVSLIGYGSSKTTTKKQ